jgi:hypothetical protein
LDDIEKEFQELDDLLKEIDDVKQNSNIDDNG